MARFGVDTRPVAAASGGGGGGGRTGAGESALSFLSRGLQEVLRLIRAWAEELVTFLNAPVPEPELSARLCRGYSSSAFSTRTRLDLADGKEGGRSISSSTRRSSSSSTPLLRSRNLGGS